MKDFSLLLDQKKLKREFLVCFIASLSNEFIDDVRDKIVYENCNLHIKGSASTFNVTDVEYALIMKVRHIVFNLGDFSGAVRMLNSITTKGVKRLKNTDKSTNIGTKRDRAEWKESAHGEYLSMGANDPQAHFRWNYGKRYVLATETLNKVYQFLCNHNLKLN